MISLQQIELSNFTSTPGSSPVAYLRRCSAVLSINKHELTVSRQTEKGTWGECGHWNMPSTSQVIGFYALEVYYSFMVLLEREDEVVAYFLDMSANVSSRVKLANSWGGFCADFDNQRKEIMLLTRKCEVKSYAVRYVLTRQQECSAGTYHIIFRLQTRLPSGFRSTPIQLLCQDVPGCLLILTSLGHISCWDSGSLEILWHIDKDRFISLPRRLFADKFGADFAVMCKSDDENICRLEFWSPPSTFLACTASTFERFSIPLKSHLLHMHIETVGGDFGTAIMLIQSNRHAQFWIYKNQLKHHCDLVFSGVTTGFGTPKFHITDGTVDSRPTDDKNFDRRILFLAEGIGAFTEARGLPGCEVLYLGLAGDEVCMIALHSPCVSDQQWLEASRMQCIFDESSDEMKPTVDLSSYSPDAQLSMQSPAGGNARHILAMTDSLTSSELINAMPVTPADLVMSPSSPGANVFSPVSPQKRASFEIDKCSEVDGGAVFYYRPMSLLTAFHPHMNASKDAALQAVSPGGLVVVSEPSSTRSASTCDIRRVTRQGVIKISKPTDSIPPNSALQFTNVGVACRAGMLVVITDIKEGFVFNLKANFSGQQRPIRLEVEISPQAKVTTLLVADVFINLSPEQLESGGHKATVEGLGIIGTHALSMVGDSQGMINFALCNQTSVLHQGSIRAHDTAVAAIIATGDSLRSLWRLGTAKSGRSSSQLCPKSSPGSAIVSISVDGQLKVWQPMFFQASNARSSHAQILSIYQISWRIAGIGELIEMDSINTVTFASLGPACITFFTGSSDGSLAQWPIPGLLDRGGGKVQVVRDSIWSERRHTGTITGIQSWVNLPNCTVKAASIDFSMKGDAKAVKYSTVVGDHICTNSEEGSIALSLDDMKLIAENSTFVTTSADKTITLWRYMVSRSMPVPDFFDSISKRRYPSCRYLTPVRCQTFTVSSTPELAFCYPMTSCPGSSRISQWRISALVGGIVVTLAQGSKGQLFLSKEKSDKAEKRYGESVSNIDSPRSCKSGGNSVASYLSDDRSIISNADGMCVICAVHRPQVAANCASKKGVKSQRYSWDIYPQWQKGNIDIPEAEFITPEIVTPDIKTSCDRPTDAEGRSESPTGRDSSTSLKYVVEKPCDTTENFPQCVTGRIVDVTAAFKPPESVARQRVNLSSVAPKKYGVSKGSPTKGKHTSKDSGAPSHTSSTNTTKMKSIMHNGVHMKVPETTVGDLESIVPKDHSKKYIISRDQPYPPAIPLVEDVLSSEDNSSNMVPTVSAEPRSPPPTVTLPSAMEDLKRIQDTILELPQKISTVEGHDLTGCKSEREIEVNAAPVKTWRKDTPREYDISDEISEDSVAVVDSPVLHSSLNSGASMQVVSKEALFTQAETATQVTPHSVGVLYGGNRSGTRGVVQVDSRPGTGRSDPYTAVIPPRPSMRQPYRGTTISTTLTGALKDKYEPRVERYVANPVSVCGQFPLQEGVSVYRTPAPHKDDDAMNYLCDGGLEKVPRIDLLSSLADRPYMRNPPSFYERSERPLFYRMTSRDKVMRLKSTVESEEWSDDDDESDDDLSVMTGDLSSESQVKAVEKTLVSSEKSLYESMTPEEKKQFLLKKREENKKIIQQSKEAFDSFIQSDSKRSSMTESAEPKPSESLSTADESPSLDSADLDIPKQVDTVTGDRVMQWDKLQAAATAGVSQNQITEIMQQATSQKRRKGKGDLQFNLKQFTKFAKLLNKVVLELQCPPEINVEIADVRHDSADISIESTKEGTVFVVVFKEGNSVPKAKDFDDLESLRIRYKGISQIITKPLRAQSAIEFSINNLKAKHVYKVYCCAQHTQTESGTAVRMKDSTIAATLNRFRTDDYPPEILDIEWNRLDNENRHDEMVAAIYDVDVQMAAKKDNIKLPTADMLEDWLNSFVDDSDKSSADEGDDECENGTAKDAVKQVNHFIKWWTGGDMDFGFSEVRSDFMQREALYVCNDGETIELCEDDGYLTFPQSEKLTNLVKAQNLDALVESDEYIIFRSWLKGGRVINQRLEKAKEEREDKKLDKLRQKLERKEVKLLEKQLVEKGKENLKLTDDTESAENESVSESAGNKDNNSVSDNNTAEENPAIKSGPNTPVEEENLDKDIFASKDDEDVDSDDDDLSDNGDDGDDDPRRMRLVERSERLQDRSANVQDAIQMVSNLHMAYKHGEDEGLSVRDLELKRGQLRMEAITVIMAMKKMTEVCEMKNLVPRDVTEDMYQLISGASTFVDISDDSLRAEVPPQATLLTLMGQDKRPIKGWDKATEEEKAMEIQLACMISTIVELAVEVGVCVPDVEDALVLHGPFLQPSRQQRWEKFEKWYVGNELHENPLRAIPTVARIMFTDWEKRVVKADVRMKERLILRSKEAAAPAAKKVAKRLLKRPSEFNLSTSRSRSNISDEEDVAQIYENEVNKPQGDLLRCEVLGKHIKAIISARHFSMLRLLWPPAGPSKPTSQYLFPRLGLITPKYVEPVKRFKPFPSISNETYSVEEVMSWYSSMALQDDDEMMHRGELEGQKHQAYLNWLAEEEVRMEAGRKLMREEDKRSAMLRTYTKTIEIDRELPVGKPRFKDFSFGNKLPGQYDHIKQTVQYVDGSGIDNEDEVMDVVEEMAREAEVALQQARELKRLQVEERKRKEEEERIRQEKAERDQRIEENKDRLKRVREHLENLKAQRRQEAEDARLEEEAKQRQVEFARILKEEREAEKENQRQEQLKTEKEIMLMQKEDIAHQHYRSKMRDFANMEHEDIMGQLRREEDNRVVEIRRQRIAELEELYDIYEPFQFKKVRLPNLHVFDDDMTVTDDGGGDFSACNTESLIPTRVDWKKYVTKDTEFDDLMMPPTSEGKLQDHMEVRNEKSRSKPLSRVLSASNISTEKKVWPRSDNSTGEMAALIWDGPRADVERAHSKLRKRDRAYTPVNPGERDYVRKPELAEFKEVVMVHSSVVDALKATGAPRSLLKSIGKGSRAKSDFDDSYSDSILLPPVRSSSAGGDANLQQRQHRNSFVDPLVYKGNAETLQITSPSKPCELYPDDVCFSSDQPNSLLDNPRSKPIVLASLASLKDNKRLLAKTSPVSVKLAKKDGGEVMKKIRAERDALRAFISASAMDNDKYFLEACRPGLRSRDSINSDPVISEYRRNLFRHMDATGNALWSGENTHDDVELDKKQTSSTPAPLEIGPLSSGQSASRVSFDTKSTTNGKALTASTTSPEISSRAPFVKWSPEISNTLTYDCNPEESVPEYKKHTYAPPFQRRTFGVKGKVVSLTNENPVVLSRNKAAECLKDNSGKYVKTIKSKQRDEYTSIKRQSIDVSHKAYSLSDVNFQDNKGL